MLYRVGGEFGDQEPHIIQEIPVVSGFRQLHYEPMESICPNVTDDLGTPRKPHFTD